MPCDRIKRQLTFVFALTGEARSSHGHDCDDCRGYAEMNRRSRIAWYLIAAIASTLIGAVPASSALAVQPAAASSLVGAFLFETDHTYGFSVLTPATWKSVGLGAQRSFVPAAVAGQPVALTVTNFRETAAILAPSGTYSSNYEMFQRSHGSLTAWTSEDERFWTTNRITFKLVRSYRTTVIYLVEPNPQETDLVAYRISQGQPLGLSLRMTGARELRELEDTGVVSDFETMALSASAATIPASPKTSAKIAPDAAGPFFGDSGYYFDGLFTERLQTTYYQAPPTIYMMYEYMHYASPQSFTMWLYRADITDYAEEDCAGGGPALLQHPISKYTTPTNGTVTDAWYPNKILAHLNPATAHMMVFGNAFDRNCRYYYPFTH